MGTAAALEGTAETTARRGEVLAVCQAHSRLHMPQRDASPRGEPAMINLIEDTVSLLAITAFVVGASFWLGVIAI